MSDVSQGPGWWQASDDRWYPPESHPDYRPPPPDARPAPPAPAAAPQQAAEPLELRGQNGTVTFDGRFISIARKGLMARATVGKGEKRIPVKSVTAVQWKPAGFTVGYIQFTVPGGNEVRSRPGKQSADARTDENSVTFLKTQQPAFEQLRAAIEDAIA